MALCSLAHFFQQKDFSDVELILRDGQGTEDGQGATVLQRMPGHMVILSASPYFRAQAERWQQNEQQQQQQQQQAVEEGNFSSMKESNTIRTVCLTLPSAAHEPAAMALLAAMYGVKTMAELLQELPREQQLQAVILTDILQLPKATTAAVELLTAAAKAPAGLSVIVLKQFLALPAIPACLLPVVPHVMAAALEQCSAVGLPAIKASLLVLFGKLDLAWADDQLQKVLLALPLPVMELLLSLDELQVSSESNVLYMAQAYVAHDEGRMQAATAALTQHVRCPHLSMFWLAASALSTDPQDLLLLHNQHQQLKRLLLVRLADGSINLTTLQMKIRRHLRDAPSSWLLPPRQLRELPDGVSLTWHLPVAELQAACKRSARRKEDKGSAEQQTTPTWHLQSPSMSPPLNGLVWKLHLACHIKPTAGVEFVLYPWPANLPADCCPPSCHAELSCGGDCKELIKPVAPSFCWPYGRLTGGCWSFQWQGMAGMVLHSSATLVLELNVTKVDAA